MTGTVRAQSAVSRDTQTTQKCPSSYACVGLGSPGRARRFRPNSRIAGGYTIRCRKGLIAAM